MEEAIKSTVGFEQMSHVSHCQLGGVAGQSERCHRGIAQLLAALKDGAIFAGQDLANFSAALSTHLDVALEYEEK